MNRITGPKAPANGSVKLSPAAAPLPQEAPPAKKAVQGAPKNKSRQSDDVKPR